MILTDDELERYARQVVMPEIGEEGQNGSVIRILPLLG